MTQTNHGTILVRTINNRIGCVYFKRMSSVKRLSRITIVELTAAGRNRFDYFLLESTRSKTRSIIRTVCVGLKNLETFSLVLVAPHAAHTRESTLGLVRRPIDVAIAAREWQQNNTRLFVD